MRLTTKDLLYVIINFLQNNIIKIILVILKRKLNLKN